MTDGRFRVLALDGGGVRGVFSAAFLATVEEMLGGTPIADKFDLMVGTSTGGIIALGMAAGHRPRDILSMYEQHAQVIFPEQIAGLSWWRRALRSFRGPLYSPEPLRGALQSLFGQQTLADLRQPTVVTAVDAVLGRVRLFKSLDDPQRLMQDRARRVVDVAMATAAAPFYFPAHETGDGRWLDGGLWANSPVAVAAAEAVGFMRVDRDRVRILSIGTTGSPFHLHEPTLRGLWTARKSVDIANLAMVPQMSGALGLAQTILGHRDRITRVAPEVVPGRFALDRADDVAELVRVGTSEALHSAETLGVDFFGV